MASLHDDLTRLRKSAVRTVVDSRLRQFRTLFRKGEEDWFSELCFCLLTANAKQKTAAAVQQSLGAKGFLTNSKDELVQSLRDHKHRFHNNKAKFIVLARSHMPVKKKVLNVRESEFDRGARDWLADNVSGLGMKEASHFLRNVGILDVAIIDRHILRVLQRYAIIRSIPQSLTKKTYLSIENKLAGIAQAHDLSLGELDLYLWYMNTGEVLK